jgi:hypothetical protein
MKVKTKKKRRISSVEALQEVEGAVQRDQESGRSHLSPEAG